MFVDAISVEDVDVGGVISMSVLGLGNWTVGFGNVIGFCVGAVLFSESLSSRMSADWDTVHDMSRVFVCRTGVGGIGRLG